MKQNIEAKKRGKKVLCLSLLCALLFGLLLLFSLQIFGAHRSWALSDAAEETELGPILGKENLETEDYAVLLLQTGLGKSAIDSLRAKGESGISSILSLQEVYGAGRNVRCTPLLGWFTREDILVGQDGEETKGPPLISLQPGDILISLSTHSLGWSHGHAALVLDEENALESLSLGQTSAVRSVDSWRTYSNYAVLRVKDAPMELCHRVAGYARETLHDIPYRLLSGVGTNKLTSPDSKAFGAQCAYLVWYAWAQYGVDVDGDGGRFVTPNDLLMSDCVELVQAYGMSLERFLARMP